jgi:hypothetical protein
MSAESRDSRTRRDGRCWAMAVLTRFHGDEYTNAIIEELFERRFLCKSVYIYKQRTEMTTTNDRADLSSEGAPAIDNTILENVKTKLISGHETHMGLESRTY